MRESTEAPVESAAVCANCGAPLGGEYCQACGERRLHSGEHTLRHIAGEWFEAFSHGEGRLLASLRLLLFKPGGLTREYFRGRRVPYTRPVALFFAVNLLYFLLSADATFSTPLYYQLVAAPWAQAKQAVVAERALGSEFTPATRAAAMQDYLDLGYRAMTAARRSGHVPGEAELQRDAGTGRHPLALQALLRYEQVYNQRTDELSRALVIAFIPLLACWLWLVLAPLRRHLPELAVFATHAWSGVLLVLLAVGWLLWGVRYGLAALLGHLPVPFQGDSVPTAVAGLLALAYLCLAVRGYFRFSRLGSLALSAWMFGGLCASLELYRVLLFFATCRALPG